MRVARHTREVQSEKSRCLDFRRYDRAPASADFLAGEKRLGAPRFEGDAGHDGGRRRGDGHRR